MRILLLTHRLPYSPNRGDRIRAYHILRTLRGHADVDVLSLVHSDDEETHVDAMRDLAASVTIARVPRLRNLVRAVAALPGPEALTHVLLSAPSVRHLLEEIVSSHPPAVVLAYCSGVARYALKPPLDRYPLVLDMVDVDSAKWHALALARTPPVSWIYAREARRLSAFEIHAMHHARMTIAVNERERQALQELLPAARVRVVENGIDLSSFRRKQEAGAQPIAIFCGVMNYGPNAEAAERLGARIWPLVRARNRDARLMIVGSNPTRNIQGLARDASITVTNTVPDVRPYLWAAAVSVAPLAIARGVQNKVLEALAAGLPVVVSPAVFDGLPLSARAGCVVRSSDESIADAIVELLAAAPAERTRLAEQADLKGLGWEQQLAPLPGILRNASGQ